MTKTRANRVWVVLLSVSLMLAMPCAAGATTYYVDYEAGDDANLGTARETAWQHAPGDSAAGGKAAEAKLEPGDIVKFKGNVIYRGSIAVGTSGAAGKPIVYDGNADGDWGEGKAIIEGSLPLTNLQRCRNAQEAEGNPNFRQIYWTTLPKGANWKAINVCQGTTPVAWSQDPNPADPVFQENLDTFHRAEEHMPRTLSTIHVEDLGGIGQNSGRPLIAMFDGTGHSAVIHEMANGAEVKVTLERPVTVVAFSVTPFRRYVNPKEMSFLVDGKEVLRTELEYHPTKSVKQRFELPAPVTFKSMVIKFHSAYPLPNGEKRAWGAVQEIAGYDANGDNVLVAKQTGVLRNDEVFRQDDPHFYDGALLAMHASPNFVYYTPITGYDPATHTITFEPLGYDHRPSRAFSIVNNPRFIDTPGEYAVVLKPEPDGSHKLLMWPPDGTPDKLTRGAYGVGFRCDASFVTIQGFWIRKQGWDASTGIEASTKNGRDLTVRDCRVTNLRGNGAGIHSSGMDYVLVDNCDVSNNAGHIRGILIRNASYVVTRGCRLHRNSATALDYYTVVNGVVQDCQVTENTGMHANGLTFYVGCKNILIERNIVRDGNAGITLHTGENMIIRNNIIEGGRGGAPAVGLWAGQPFNQIVMANNVFRYHGQGGGDPTMGIYGGNQGAKGYAIVNNIIDGISGNVLLKADLHHNLFTRLGPGMTFAQLGDNRLVQNLDGIFVDAPGHDYRPTTDSPAVDTGVDIAKLNAYDIEGVPRPQGKAVDIGPYEVIPGGTDLKSKRQFIDPHDFKFTFAGYEIAPPPEFKVAYQLRFKRREGAKTIVKKGIDLTGEGGGQVKHRPTRGGYVAHWYNPGHWLEWTVEVAEAGPYEVVIEHASQTAAKRKVILNGQPVGGLQEFAFPLTGDWTTWGKTSLDQPLMLEQGSNKIRFDHVQGHLNFKSLEFIPVVPEKGK